MDTLYAYPCRQALFPGAVPAFRIDEEVPQVYLVLVEVQPGGVFVVPDREYDLSIVIDGADMVAEFSAMATVAWCGELEFADDPEPVADCVAIDSEGYLQVGSVEDCCRCQFQAHDREVRNGSRFRNAFLTDAGESVVCGHEQVISADVAAGVERWPLGSDRLRQGVPLQLLIVPEVPPLPESSLMDRQLHLLPRSTGEHRSRLRPVIALTVFMKKRNVPDRSITVREP